MSSFQKKLTVFSRYERAQIIGMRGEQIAGGARPFVECAEDEDPNDIAQAELRAKRIPFIVKRTLPNGTIELWRLEELLQEHWDDRDL